MCVTGGEKMGGQKRKGPFVRGDCESGRINKIESIGGNGPESEWGGNDQQQGESRWRVLELGQNLYNVAAVV